jgi:hypothetical protein
MVMCGRAWVLVSWCPGVLVLVLYGGGGGGGGDGGAWLWLGWLVAATSTSTSARRLFYLHAACYNNVAVIYIVH